MAGDTPGKWLASGEVAAAHSSEPDDTSAAGFARFARSPPRSREHLLLSTPVDNFVCNSLRPKSNKGLTMLESLWDRMLISLATKVPPAALDSWLRPCRLSAVEGDHVKIAAPNTYTRDWLHQHHTESLQAAAREVLGGNPRVSLDIDRDAPSPANAPNATEPPVAAPGLSVRYTFDSFVVGNSNQFAQAACQAVAELPSRAYNPLFIYGGVGLGKTHLLHAVGHQIARLYPHLRLLYLSSERFTNDLINAIRYDRTAEFRAKYRTIDLLLIDDIQFISGKERTQEEFFHTFNDLYEARKQIVVSSDSAPKEIPELEERLRSRFEWGLIDHIQRKVAEVFGIKLSDMRAQNRTKSVAFPRQIAMYLSRQLTHASLSDVGRAFGGKDHTTVLHAVTKLQALLQEDPKLKQTIDTLVQGITL